MRALIAVWIGFMAVLVTFTFTLVALNIIVNGMACGPLVCIAV